MVVPSSRDSKDYGWVDKMEDTGTLFEGKSTRV
jgi:hypothetical protein